MEREGVAKLQQADVRVKVPRLDGGGPFGIALDAFGEQYLQSVLFGNELRGFLEVSPFGWRPLGRDSEEGMEKRRRMLGPDAGRVQPVGVQADE